MPNGNEAYTNEVKRQALTDLISEIKLKISGNYENQVGVAEGDIPSAPPELSVLSLSGYFWELYEEGWKAGKFLFFLKYQFLNRRRLISIWKNPVFSDLAEITCTIFDRNLYDTAKEAVTAYGEKYGVEVIFKKGFND